MPKPPLPEHIVDMLARPNPAVIGAVRPDGAPATVPTWYLWGEDGRILINMDAERRRVAYFRSDPRVSLTVLDDDWYNHVSVRGPITLRDDPDLADIDRIARHYTGQPYWNRDRPRVSGWIDIEHWHAWGALARP